MVTKKTIQEGMLVKQSFTSPLSLIKDFFFGTSSVESKFIRHGTPEYRKYREELKSKKETWGAVSTGIDKQRVADKKSEMMGNRGRV